MTLSFAAKPECDAVRNVTGCYKDVFAKLLNPEDMYDGTNAASYYDAMTTVLYGNEKEFCRYSMYSVDAC